jgi:hypothetical protein
MNYVDIAVANYINLVQDHPELKQLISKDQYVFEYLKLALAGCVMTETSNSTFTEK